VAWRQATGLRLVAAEDAPSLSVAPAIVVVVSDQPTLKQILEDPVAWGYSQAEADQLRNDLVIGQAAQLLLDREEPNAAALMRDVQLLEFEYTGDDSSYRWMDSPPATVNAYLDVAPFITRRFTEERLDEIKAALSAIKSREHIMVERVVVRHVLPNVGADWREHFDKNLTAERPTNQGQRVRLESRIQAHGLFLTNAEERRVYDVLCEVQAQKPDNDTFGIAPLAGLRIPGHTYWPDFLITYRNKVGIIEVDGPRHHGRAAADKSRDHLLMKAGIKYVGRIVVEDVKSKPEAIKWVEDYLKILSDRWRGLALQSRHSGRPAEQIEREANRDRWFTAGADAGVRPGLRRRHRRRAAGSEHFEHRVHRRRDVRGGRHLSTVRDGRLQALSLGPGTPHSSRCRALAKAEP